MTKNKIRTYVDKRTKGEYTYSCFWLKQIEPYVSKEEINEC